MIVYLNGKFLPESKAHISINDHGFLYGDGVYETLRVYNGHVFHLSEHLERLAASAKGIHCKLPISISRIGEAIEKTVKTNRHKEASVRLTLTRGPGLHGFDPRLCKTPTLLIASRPFHGYPSALYKKGMTAAVVSVRRNSPEALPPSVKSISCLNNILAKTEAIQMKADEAILLTEEGTVAEGTVSNVFIVKDGVLFTPVLDGRQLAGVTRHVVCQLARDNGLRVGETKLFHRDLSTADEIFLTSTLMEIMPVTRLLSAVGGDNARTFKIGPVTQRVAQWYKKLLHSAPS